MIDIHSHILHCVDDGSESLTQSLEALKILKQNGVKKVVLTPHFMLGGYDNTSNKIQPKIAELKNAAQNLGIELFFAAEVYLTENSLSDIKQNNFNINNGSYVLIETTMSGFENNFYQMVFDIAKTGLKPILAHPERYKDVMQNPSIAQDLIHHNMYLQINAGSLLGHYGFESEKAAWYMLEHGFVHFIASDYHCHNKPYILQKAFELVKNKIDDYTANLLFIENPQKVLDSKPIERFYLSLIDEEIKPKSFIKKLKSLFKK